MSFMIFLYFCSLIVAVYVMKQYFNTTGPCNKNKRKTVTLIGL